MDKKITLSILGIVLLIIGICLFAFGFQNNIAKQNTKVGDIHLKYDQNDAEFIAPEDDEWKSADRRLYDVKPNNVSIVDNEGLLSTEDFLSTKAHFMKSEAIGNFLKENGYECDEVAVLKGSLSKIKNNSFFQVTMEDYPGIILNVTYYSGTEEFEFKIINNPEEE